MKMVRCKSTDIEGKEKLLVPNWIPSSKILE
jgi:hypothetical protein